METVLNQSQGEMRRWWGSNGGAGVILQVRMRGIHRRNPADHHSYLNVHPTFGFSLGGLPARVLLRITLIVDFEPFRDGFEPVQDSKTAKPQTFRTGDGWFAYNLAVNLAHM